MLPMPRTPLGEESLTKDDGPAEGAGKRPVGGGPQMFEYEFIQQRNAELQRAAEQARLVREAGTPAVRAGVLQWLARGVRPTDGVRRTVEPRAARLSEC